MNQTQAAIFATTARGGYIISQALYVASQQLAESEPGNAEDMRDLRAAYFTYQPPIATPPELTEPEVEGRRRR